MYTDRTASRESRMTIGDTLRHLTRTADDPRADGELLTRFARGRDEVAFAELLRRHGPTVYGVCRRTLGNTHDADAAFQAVLARKAESIRPPGQVGNWLYGVAVRTANKARAMNTARRVVIATWRAGGGGDRNRRSRRTPRPSPWSTPNWPPCRTCTGPRSWRAT
jgi:hypothetical protein